MIRMTRQFLPAHSKSFRTYFGWLISSGKRASLTSSGTHATKICKHLQLAKASAATLKLRTFRGRFLLYIFCQKCLQLLYSIFLSLLSQRRHSSGSSLLEALDEEETKKLAECLEKILDVVGESMPEIHGQSWWQYVIVAGLKQQSQR